MADVQIVETRELKVERTDDLKELNNEPVIMEAMESDGVPKLEQNLMKNVVVPMKIGGKIVKVVRINQNQHKRQGLKISEPRNRETRNVQILTMDNTGETKTSDDLIVFLKDAILKPFTEIVPQCENNLSNIKNIIQSKNFENIIRQIKTIESRLVLLHEKLSKRYEKEARTPSAWHRPDNSQISKADLLVEVAQLRARNQKCICGKKKVNPVTSSQIMNEKYMTTKTIKPRSSELINSLAFGQKSNIITIPHSSLLQNKVPNLHGQNMIQLKQPGDVLNRNQGIKKVVRMPPNLNEPAVKYAKVLIRDENGIEKHVLIPTSKLNTQSNPAKEVKDPTFFLGNDKETESSDTPGVSIKTEILEENCDSDVEIINTSKECSFDRDDQSIQNLMEESEITKTEIKEEPDNDYQDKIFDGIDHTALEGLINLCEQENPDNGEEEDKDTETSHEVDEEVWTDDKVQEEIDRISGLKELEDPMCAICRRRFTSIAYLKSHMRAHKEPLRCNVCYMEFRMKSKLKNHELMHIYPTPRICSLPNCGLVFRTESEIEAHELSHQERFKCEICGKLLASEKSKNEHKVTFHLGGSEFMCETCGKAFSNKSTLNRHRLLHQVEKPYPCTLCKRAFIDQKTLKNHQKTCSKHFFSVIDKKPV